VGARGKGINEQLKAETGLSGALARLFAVAEQYPNLKANENFIALQHELASTEDKISFSRQFYNDTVLQYNNAIQMFPSNIVAKIFHFIAGVFFGVTDKNERDVPQVKF
jgi:LemA protein